MYDFKNMVNRQFTGSIKWEEMYASNPLVGQDIVPFSIADMEFIHAPEITQGLKNFIESSILGYSTPYPKFLEAVKSWQKRRHNFNISSEWIVCTQGVIAAISAAIRGFTKIGDGVILMSPVYYPFYSAVEKNTPVIIYG